MKIQIVKEILIRLVFIRFLNLKIKIVVKMEIYTENDFFNDLNKYVDLDLDKKIFIDIDNINLLYNYILDTKNGIKQTKILVLYGNTKNIIDIIKKYLLSSKFVIGNTNVNYFQNLIVNKHLNKMKNTHSIYNITKVNKLFIISDNDCSYSVETEIFKKLIDDEKIITNFIIETNKRKNNYENDIFVSVLE